jgi:hypothetical protein
MPGFPDPTTPWWQDWGLSYVGDPYGPILGGHSVQIATLRTLRKWLPVYIKDVNRQLGGNVLRIVEDSFHPFEDRVWSTDEDVQIDVIVPGTTGKPALFTNGGYQSCWKMEIHINVYAGSDWQETLALTYAYAAVARAAIIQHRDLEGFSQTTMWTGEQYFKGKDTGDRYVGMATVGFEVTVSTTVDPFAGPPAPQFAAEGTPTEPSLLPLPPFPEVLQTDVSVEQQALTNPNGSPTQ